ncbi:uncharacterized protein LOC127279460 [Leptopilina boulardi]|uniref:uncharacterized protein LOC127279460 n=1 Tax=Leptopilina boulardi TaxID=63433 RepID=UPI0021F6475A|nr:uncharacterized protein LOC127279460 [Leptopilina boulardi]
MAEPSTQKRRPERKPRTAGAKTSLFGKDVRSHLRKAKFKKSRKLKSDETDEAKKARIQERLPPPQPKMRLLPCDESEKDEESEEEFLSYVKATVSDDKTYNYKDEKNCSLGCCKSCGLFSHDLTYLKSDAKSNVHNEFKHSKTQLNKTELTNTHNLQKTTEIDEKNASGDSNVSKLDKNLTDLKDEKTIKTPNDKSSNSEIDNLEEELDSLLTMEEPISKTPMLSQIIPTSKVKEPICTSATVPTKSVDLEKWLESVLDV